MRIPTGDAGLANFNRDGDIPDSRKENMVRMGCYALLLWFSLALDAVKADEVKVFAHEPLQYSLVRIGAALLPQAVQPTIFSVSLAARPDQG